MPRICVRAPVRMLSVGLAVTLSVVAVACGGSSGSSPSPTTPAPQSGGVTVEQGAGGAFVFSPAKVDVAKGTTITLKDVSSVPHTFTITDQGIDIVNNPGQSQQLAIDLAPGTYEFICRFHVSRGMKGTLTVT